MKRDEYLETIIVHGHMVNVGMDDAGQQYFYEFVNENGELEERGCGAYNFHYYEDILSHFDYKGYYISMYGREAWNDLLKLREERGIKNDESFDTMDYNIYDISGFYQSRGLV